MRNYRFTRPRHGTRCSGFTLVEVVISMGIAAIGIGGIIWGYILTSHRAEWATCSAAAQQMAMRRLEQTRAAKWDPFAYPPVDELQAANFPQVIAPLDLPLAGTTRILATNVISILTVYTDPPLKVIRVDCAWSVMSRGPFTNTLLTYRTSDW